MITINNEKLKAIVTDLITDVALCSSCCESEIVVGKYNGVYISIRVTDSLPDDCFDLQPNTEVIKVIKENNN